MRRRRADVWTLVLWGGWALLALLLAWPLSTILAASVTGNADGGFSLANYAAVFGQPRYHRAIVNTLIAGTGGMAGSVVLGLTLAFLTTRYRIRGRAVIQTLALLALVSPPFIGAYAWIVLFGGAGVVRRALMDLGIAMPPIYGTLGVVLVFAFKFFPHVFLITGGALAAVNRSLEEAAEGLGLSPARRFFTVTLPLILPALTSSALLTFVLSIADFGTPQLIGRNFPVLATEAFNLYTSEVGGNHGMASALSITLLVLSLAVVLLQRWSLRRDHFHGNLLKRPEVRPVRGGKAVLVHGLAYLIVLVGSLPAFVVLLYSFRATRGPVFQPGYGLQSYRRVIDTVSDAILNTLAYSSAAVVAIVITGTLLGYVVARRPSASSSALDAVLMVPYIVPGIVMGIAFIASFNTPPLVLTGTGAIIVAAVFIRRLPYTVRSVATNLRQVAPSLEDAAVSLGCSPAQAFRKVTVPLIAPGILAGGMISFITAMNELSSSLVLYVGRTVTMPVRIYIAVLDGEYGVASALSTMLLAVTAIAVYAAFVLSGRRERALF
jgi:iron(III) transport system permease protein